MDDEDLLLKGANAEQWRFRVWALACKKMTQLVNAAAGVKYILGVDELEAADLDKAHDAILAETKSALEAGDPVGAVVWGWFIDRHEATLTAEAAEVISAACICYPLLEWDDPGDHEVALALLELRLRTPRDTPAKARAQQEQALRCQVGLKQIRTASQAMLDQGAPAVVIQGYLTGGIGLLRGESWQEHFRDYMGAFQKSLLRALNGCEDERAVVADNLEVLLAELLPSKHRWIRVMTSAVTLHNRKSHLVFSSSRGLSSFPCAWFRVEGADIDPTENGFEVVFAEPPRLTHGNLYALVRGAGVAVRFRPLGELSSRDIFRLRQLDLVS